MKNYPGFNEFVELLHKTKNKNLLEDFLIGITTPHERQILARRIEIVKRLLAHEPHHQIASELKIGVSTVTRGSRELAKGRFKILRKP